MAGRGTDPSGGSGTTTDESGAARPIGRADATGPLPVTLPADATGPLPADMDLREEPGPEAAERTADGPAAPAGPAVAHRPEDEPDLPPGPIAPPTVGLPLIADDPVEPSAYVPRSPAEAAPTTGIPTIPAPADGAPTAGLPSVPAAAPPPPEPADLFDPGPPHPGPDPHGRAVLDPGASASHGAADLFNPDLAHPGPPPPAPPPPPPPPGAGPASLFDPGPAGGPPWPPPAGAPQGGPPPAGAAAPAPSVFTPAVTQADATGPMPALHARSGQVPAVAPTGRIPAAPPAGTVPPPATGALPRTPRETPHAGPQHTGTQHTGTRAPAEIRPPGEQAEPGTGATTDPDPAATTTATAASEGSGAWAFTTGERPGGRGTQSWPPPSPEGKAHSGTDTGTGQAVAGAAPRRRRRAWPLTLVGILVAIVAGVALTLWLARTQPGELVTAAATEAEGWSGARYQGTVAALDGGEIRFDLTVTAAGTRGSLSRNGGSATAELVRDASGTLLRGNKEWWLYHHAARADDLADVWVADPLTEIQEIDPVLQLHPHALAADLRPDGQPRPWEALERLQVDGQDALVLVDGDRRVAVAAAPPHPPLALDVGPADGRAPVRVSGVPPEEAGTVDGAAASIRAAEAPKSLAQRLQERPQVAIALEPETRCVTETCTVTITVTNSGTSPARGKVEVSADGTIVATHPLDVPPGQAATFTAAAPNPQFTTPGATGRIIWAARAVDD
ncbi:hypothetical protein [Pseudonocardia kunmingensis]|uniref:Uncharacterized protein n=1 Tax=Pseudonocardia kunmingensis TaxID=630975 RepID=A0A543DI97_9PSEU|nr:hypothetical protein [Pseudonocardia kunmingensis]TQM09050.1 hypothetical protein FB558_4791 [Pseudonocardia kunmingensis]